MLRLPAPRDRASLLVVALLSLYCLLSLAATAGAATGAPVNLASPTVGGTAEDEHLVKAIKGKWSGEIPIVYSYQWQRCDGSGEECEDIPAAIKGSYRATHADVGKTVRVRVKASNAAGSASLTSGPSPHIVPAPPHKKALAKITGTPEDGQLMTVSNGLWKGTPPLSYSYQWESCSALGTECAAIAGATSAGYRPVTSQIGGKLRAIVTASNVVGSAGATSYASKLLKAGPPVSTAAPSIAGSLKEGQTVSASLGTWAGTAPFAFGYQWQRCALSGGSCQDIAGATGPTYALEAGDLASRLAVVISASNAYGSATASSTETSPVAAILPSNTLLPSITGLLQDGNLLSVGTGTWSGSGPITYTFQWQLCNGLGLGCVDIAGEKSASLALSAGDIGGTLDVVVTATNAAGSTSVTAPVTSLILGILPSNTLLPSIGGLLQDGQLLSVGTGSWSGSEPISFSYQWRLCNALGEACSDISKAIGSSLGLGALDIGKTLDVVVTATNAAGSTSVTTPVTDLIAGILPSNTALPSVSGLLTDGSLLSAVTGSWSGSAPISYAYQWQLCNAAGASCSNIAEATGSTLKMLTSFIGSTLRVVETAKNAAGSMSATSSATGLIGALLPSNTLLPSIGGLLQDGQLLSVGTGSWSGSEPISFSYQWQLCNALGGACSDISKATGSSLSLGALDIGKTLDVVVTATNAAGSTSVTTSVTDLVAGILPSNTALPSVTGTLIDGALLSAGAGSWSGSAPISYAYQWQLCNAAGGSCGNIAEATGSTLKLLTSFIGSTLRVVETAKNAAGSTSATSSATGVIGALLPSNTTLPSIGGLLQDGQLLSVGTGSWSGSEPISFSYQWRLCNALGEACSDISKAIGSSLGLGALDIGKTLDVVVTATNAAGSTSVTTPVTDLIAGILPSNTALPSVTGTLIDGSLLSAAAGSWSGSAPIRYGYQWQLCNAAGASCSNIAEATGSTLKLLTSFIGSTLRVLVTAKNAGGSTSATSSATGLIGALLPSNTALPSVAGTLIDGSLLSAATGSWSGSAPITYAYQWQLCNAAGGSCSNIAEATGSTLKLLTSFIGSTLRVVETAKNAAGSTSATSSATGLIGALLPSNTALPSVTGTLIDGSLLSAATGSWSGSAPITYGYQWQLCNAAGASCSNIAEATGSTLKLLTSFIGSTLRVLVTAKNAGGSTSATSSATGLIGALLPSNNALPTISGILKVGQLLTAATGTWSGSAPITYGYQWQLCNLLGEGCNNIAGATSSTFLLGVLDLGLPVRVVVTATNAAGSVPKPSEVTGLIKSLL